MTRRGILAALGGLVVGGRHSGHSANMAARRVTLADREAMMRQLERMERQSAPISVSMDIHGRDIVRAVRDHERRNGLA